MLDAFVESHFVVFGVVDNNFVGSLVTAILVVACPAQVHKKTSITKYIVR